MHRTTIMLDETLKAQVELQARRHGVSLAEWIRGAVTQRLRAPAGVYDADPLFEDTAVFTGETPADYAEKHDEYLYG